ncbi:MAG: exodeoxyribonuclease III [Pseudomonadota bacterium]|nr:MAG: exodeoxyribonuclease III [Pseudomonadota bacterium]
MLAVASWNVNSLRVRMPQVLDWLRDTQPDVIGIQETKTVDEAFPVDAIEAAGYRAIFSGQKTYNGVALLSCLEDEAADVVTDIPELDDPQRRVIGATYGNLRVINLYVPNGSEVGSEKYAYKLDWLDKLATYLEAQLQAYDQIVVIGDFNIAPEDRDVHDPAAWEGSVLVSPAERTALQRIVDLGLRDTFRLFDQAENSFSWWDYRAAGFRRNRGLRIDHILASAALAERCTSCSIDTEPRKLERPSDHAPIIAAFDI